MESYEKFENNIKVIDKYNINDIKINKSYIYSGELDLVTKPKYGNDNDGIPPLGAAILGVENTAAPLPSNLDFINIWTDVDAQEAYLNMKPTCYLILGKPGLGSYSLGEALSKKTNCIHLSSRNVILDEIEQKSPTGMCLDFNMRHNKVCKFEHILAIMEMKLQSHSVKHRGYVISGLPLITSSTSEQYFFSNLYLEESLDAVEEIIYDLMWNLKRKKPRQRIQKKASQSSMSSELDKEAEEEIEEEQQVEVEVEEAEELVQMPKFVLDTCCNIVHYHKLSFNTKKGVILQHIQEIFNFNPDVLIYIMSPDFDTIVKKERKFFSYTTNTNTFNAFGVSGDAELRWPNKYTMIDYIKPYDSHVFNPKYNCRQPINFKTHSRNQICNYKNDVFPYLEEKLKDFNTKYILKIDGRTSVHQMLHYIMGKLLMLPIKPVVVPKPLYLDEPPEDMDEFWGIVKQFNAFKSGVLDFYRFASPWNNRCPVELERRRSVQGKSKYAVTFFKHVYILSSLESMISFCKNPRPYLKVKYLEPTCRVIIMGTKSSGKTMVAECLSWLFDVPVICYQKFLKDEQQKKYTSFYTSILSEIIATIEDARFMKWQNGEIERTSNLNTWFNSVFNLLKQYVILFETYLKSLNQEEMTEAKSEIMSEKDITKFRKIKSQLSFLPILDNIDSCKEATLNTNLLKYAPIELTTITAKPLIPVLGDEDVTEAISAYILTNDLQKDTEPTTEELMIEMVHILSTIDKVSKSINQKYGKFIIDGFPSDPEFWGYLDESKLLPDYTIVLIENKEIDVEIYKSYCAIDKCIKNYQERYLLSADELIKIKLKHKTPLDNHMLDIQIIIHNLVNKVLDTIFTEEEINDYTTFIATFNDTLDKCREDLDSVKLKLEDNSKAVISAELENKSDVDILDEVLLKLRQSYYLSCTPAEFPEVEDKDDEYNVFQDMMLYNEPYSLGATNIFCPIAYNDYGVLWEGKSEFCLQFHEKLYNFCKEECLDLFQTNVTKYQSLNTPFKSMSPLRICIVGAIGSGKTSVSKQIAKELGLMHIDFSEFINDYLIPKHFKKVGRQFENSFKDTPIDDEAVMEFQADEENLNIVSDMLANETEIRRMVYNYFEKGAPLLSVFTQRLIRLLWFEIPFSHTGIVLDGFPRLPSDVEDMTSCFCIPDLVIDLQGSSEKTLNRLSSKMLKKWKIQLNDAKNEANIRFEKEKKIWFDTVTKNVVIKLIFDEIFDNIFIDLVSLTNVNLEPNISAHSTIIDAHPSGSANVDANLFKTYNEIIQDYPEPVDHTEWEKAEDVLERINARLESIFEIDDENIQTLKDLLSEHKIKNVSIDGTKSADKVFKKILPKLSLVRNRSESFFEQTFIVSSDIAETLLTEGFYLLSKFNRMCPVFISDNPHTISNPYSVYKRTNKVFPVIHRAYIYFLYSSDNVKKFRKDPLKYIKCNKINSYVEYPLRIGIIGPPKSGKSELASKIAKRFGLLCISKGLAIRHVLKNMDWTELALKMKAKLCLGEAIDSELIMSAVHSVTIDYRVVTNGFVFDGFPETPTEASDLSKLGLYPLIMFDIKSNDSKILKNSQNEQYNQLIKYKPPYSSPFIEHRYVKWLDNCNNVRSWINDDVQNLYPVDGKSSKWQCLHDAMTIIDEIIAKVNYYLCNVKSKIVPVDVMSFSNEIFYQRMSPYRNLCPVCLRKNILRHNGYPVDKKGLVQYRNILYWFCSDHMQLGLNHPDIYLKGEMDIPEIPAVVKTIDRTLLYENGICIVTYTDNLPSQIVERGDPNFAASYGGKIYLCCSSKCLGKFLAKPHMYYDITVFKDSAILPKISLKQLPDLGYLEQTLGNILTKACCYINVMRPKYPGLSNCLSGLLYIALYLKIHNPNIELPVLAMYEKTYKVYEARCKLVRDISYRLRSRDNPFAKYPSSCDPRKIDSGTVGKPSSVISISRSVSSCSEFNKVLN